jgi:hypothetical protein
MKYNNYNLLNREFHVEGNEKKGIKHALKNKRNINFILNKTNKLYIR